MDLIREEVQIYKIIITIHYLRKDRGMLLIDINRDMIG